MSSKSQTKITDTFKEVKHLKSETSGSRKRNRSKLDENIDVCASIDKNNNNNNSFSDGDFLDDFTRAKQALHLSKPVHLPCREEQIEQLYDLLNNDIVYKKGGSIYISGAPGTGKTVVVQHVLERLERESEAGREANSSSSSSAPAKKVKRAPKFIPIFINCMNVKTEADIFNAIQEVIQTKRQGRDLKDKLRGRLLDKARPQIVLVLDEMDQLIVGRSNELLYTLFEWTRLEGSPLILIGIANSLDLTVRHLPLLTASPRPAVASPKARAVAASPKSGLRKSIGDKGMSGSSPKTCRLIQFTPYERPDIEKILESRMNQVGGQVFDATAIKFVAAKVAASTGDMRRALNACHAALDSTAKTQRPILQETADDGFNSSSPKKPCRPEQKIGVAAMSKILGNPKEDNVFPLQQKIILGTLLKLHKGCSMNPSNLHDGVKVPIPVSKFYNEYRKVCSEKGFSWIDRCELTSICSLLDDRSLVHVSEGGGGTPSSKKMKNSGGGSKSVGKTGIFFDPHATNRLLQNDPIVISIVE